MNVSKKPLAKRVVNLIIKRYNEGKANIEIVRELGVSKISVRRYLKKYNVKIDKWRMPIRPKKYHVNENYFSKIDTEEKAYWLGFMAADGNVQVGPKSYGLRISLQVRDIKHLEMFKKCLGYSGPLRFYFIKGKEYAELNVNSKIISQDLQKLGFDHDKQIRIDISDKVPKKFVDVFFRGVFDGDGCLHFQKAYKKNGKIITGRRFTLTLPGSKNMITSFNKWIFLITKNNTKIRQRSPNYCEVSYNGKSDIPKITNRLYKDASIYLERKYKTYQKLVKFYAN